MSDQPIDRPDTPGATPSQSAPVKSLALLVDPASMDVVWANDAVMSSLVERGADASLVRVLGEAIPMASVLGLEEMVRGVDSSGSPAHATAPIVSTVRGSVTLVVSVYRLPDGMVLVIGENSWDVERTVRRRTDGTQRSRRR